MAFGRASTNSITSAQINLAWSFVEFVLTVLLYNLLVGSSQHGLVELVLTVLLAN